MGFRFSKRITIARGIRLNLGKKGPSVSLGGKGVTTSVSRKGARTTVSIPTTGLSYSTKRRGCMTVLAALLTISAAILCAMNIF